MNPAVKIPRSVRLLSLLGIMLLKPVISSGQDESVQAYSLSSVLVLDLVKLNEDISQQVTTRISKMLAAELRNTKKYRILSGELVTSLHEEGALDLGNMEEVVHAEELLKTGIGNYENLDYDRAVRSLNKASALLHGNRFLPKSRELIIRVLLYQALAQLARGNKDTSVGRFEELLRIRTDFKMDEVIFPPEIVRIFERTRQRVLAEPMATIGFTSSPPFATVLIDGRASGDTPVVARGIPAGTHIFVIGKPGYLSWRKEMKIPKGASLEQEVTLEKNPVLQHHAQVIESIVKGEPKQETALAASRLGKALYADYVLLSAISRSSSDKSYFTAVALVESNTGAVRKIVYSLIDTDLLNSASVLKWMAARIGDLSVTVEPAIGGEAYKNVEAALVNGIDLGKYLLGTPGVASTDVSSQVDSEPPVTDTSKDEDGKKPREVIVTVKPVPYPPPLDQHTTLSQETTPPEAGDAWYEKWWLWTAVSVVIGGGIAATLVWTSTSREQDRLMILPTLNPPAR